MQEIWFEIAIILVLILGNGVFAMSEIAMVSSRKALLKERAQRGDKKAQAALALAESPSRFLATVQIGITLVGILAGAIGGATIARHLALLLEQAQVPQKYCEPLSVGIVVIVIAYLSLVLGELVPKRFALNNPEKIAGVVAGPMSLLAALARPVVSLLSLSTEGVLRIFGAHRGSDQPVTEEEVKVLIDQGADAGVFEESERDLFIRIFWLGDSKINAHMVPRTDIVWLDAAEPLARAREQTEQMEYTWYPLCRDQLDNVIGFVQAKDVVLLGREGRMEDLEARARKPVFIPANMPALKGLETFRDRGVHFALVVDEYGSIDGLVTLADIMRAFLGRGQNGASPEGGVVQREDGSWLMDGMLPIDEFRSIMQIPESPVEERGNYQTLAGLVVNELGRIPAAGDQVAIGNIRIEVLDMDGNRVDKVQVKKTDE